MKPAYPLLAGPLAAVVLGLGIILLAHGVPGYSQVHQTVSEIGMVGSAVQTPFSLMLYAVALCMLIFGWGLGSASLGAGHSSLAGYLVACMAISSAGVGAYPFPDAPHNYFGLSELIAYQAPLALAITWRNDPREAAVVRLSWIMAVLMWVSIGANLGTLDRDGSLWAHERPFYGLVQRSLFAVFFLWCAAIGAILFLRHSRKSVSRPSPIPT